MKKKNWILVLLVLLGVVTFLDRINISVAAPYMMKELDLGEKEWGWVMSIFTLSYGLMQLPMGALGDKKGHRSILSLIVLWWSAFTFFTGMAGGLVSLLAIRFMFGVGEAGASPCSTGVVSRWFEKDEIGKAQGYIWAASRMGGALTPFVVIPIVTILGWRWAFYIMGIVGCVWVVVWWLYYRDPSAKPKGTQRQASAIKPSQQPSVVSSPNVERSAVSPHSSSIPWTSMFTARQFWLLLAMYFFYAFASWFFFTWFPIFMSKGRGFDAEGLKYAIAVPFVLSMLGNIAGGYLTDKLTGRYGIKIGRKVQGVGALVVSAVFMFLAAFIPGKTEVFVFLSLCFGVIDLMLPAAWALCIDLGKQYAGAVSGAMNTAGNLGGFVCATLFGYLVSETGDYNLPLYCIAGMLIISAMLFLCINPASPLTPLQLERGMDSSKDEA